MNKSPFLNLFQFFILLHIYPLSPVGTIFGIYKKSAKSTAKTSLKDLLRPGNELLAAGYALYDAATMLVLTTGDGVNGFTLDPSLGEFILTHRNIRIPKKGKIYSINEGNALTWDEPTRLWVEKAKQKSVNNYEIILFSLYNNSFLISFIMYYTLLLF